MKDEALVAQIEADYRQAPLPPATRALLDYAAKLTREPGHMEEADIHRLRTAGFSDRAILDVAQIVAYYAYVNRIADGLGVRWKIIGRMPERLVRRPIHRWPPPNVNARPTAASPRRAN